ncbi:MAG: competence/damage-inducible protein A [Deltaproteobacteria bacterium]|nr:competence/damage-inducible protein A [Deltaproteobacteria bacterium]
MRVEVICSGDELLAGAVSDTNTAAFASILLEAGRELARCTVVGDAEEDIVDAVREACARADVVLVSGGLGPTEDDRTAAALARAAGTTLVEDAAALQRLRERLRTYGRELTDNNRRQARIPAGARVLLSEVGTAPGFSLRVGGAVVYAVPGVPAEAAWFCRTYLLPAVTEAGSAVRSATLRCVGITEAELDARVAGLAARFPGVSVHFRTAFPENHLKLVSRHADARVAQQTLRAAVADAHARLGPVVFSDDGRTLGAVLRDLLRARNQTVAAAESCTGGLLQAWLTDEPGASVAFLGGMVSYSNAAKVNLLGVSAEDLATHGAVSAPVAEQMAVGARTRLGATWGVALTGVAGPDGGTEHKPVGTVFMGLAGPDTVAHRALRLRGDRDRIRRGAAASALSWLRDVLLA